MSPSYQDVSSLVALIGNKGSPLVHPCFQYRLFMKPALIPEYRYTHLHRQSPKAPGKFDPPRMQEVGVKYLENSPHHSKELIYRRHHHMFRY